MHFYGLLIVSSLFAYVTSSGCPAEITNCTCSSNTIGCSQRGYFVLHEGISLDHDIQHLYLDRNKLSEINDNHFMNIRSLTYLTLRENNLQKISEDALNGNTGLRTVDLSQNSLSYLPVNLFKRLNFLENIYLNNNKLKRIETDHFTHLTFLKDVRLQENELEMIGADAFINSQGIQKLYLEKNKLEIPEKNWLIHFHHTGEYEVYMDDNPWSCDCRMKEFFRWATGNQWFLKHEINGVSVPECSTPSHLRGTTLARIGSERDLICVKVNITSQIRDIKTVEGQKVVLACVSVGFPLPDVMISNSAGNIIASSPNGHADNIFESPVLADSGDYICNASGYNEDATPVYEAITIKLTVYRTPAHVVSVVLIGLFITAVAVGTLVWIYKKKFSTKSSYGRLPSNSAYYDSSAVATAARYNAQSIHTPNSGRSAPTSVTNPYESGTDSHNEDDDDVIADYSKDTEFLV